VHLTSLFWGVREKARKGACTPGYVKATVDRATAGAPWLAKFWHAAYLSGMSTMNVSLPESLKAFVDEQVSSRGYGTSSEYVRELIRKDRETQRLRSLLLEGAASAPAAPADARYFDALRDRVRRSDTR
jgi:antitoxin ParD1/3/4